jgi:sec-independent protein translocase protein TatA
MGLSPTHLILILVVVLFLFGPSRLPGLGKGIGEAIKGFKKGIKGEEIDVTPTNPTNQANQQNPNDQINVAPDIHIDPKNVKNKQKQDS